MGERSELEKRLIEWVQLVKRVNGPLAETIDEAAAAIAGLREACETYVNLYREADMWPEEERGELQSLVQKALAGLSAAPGREEMR